MNPTLHDWSIVRNDADCLCLAGDIHDSDEFPDGVHVMTSPVLEFNLRQGMAVTAHTYYQLGTPNKAWVAWLKDNGHEKISELSTKTATDQTQGR